MTANEIFNASQLDYLNSAYSPESVDYYLPSWVAEGTVYIGNWIDITKESEDSKKSLLKLYILHRAFQIPQMAGYSEDLRVNLNENLKQVQKRQIRDNESKSSIYVNSSSEKFSEDFFGKYK